MTTTDTTTEHDHHRRASMRRRRWTAVTAAAVLAFAPLAACGGGDADAGAAAASSSEEGAATGSGDMQAFQECLAENGIEMGGPPSGGGDGEQPAEPDQDAMAQVQELCGDLMPEGGPGGGAGGPGGMGGEEMQAWTDCLADNGVEMTQPERGEMPSDGEMPEPGDMPEGGEGGTPFGLDTSDPEVAAAVEACADLQPEMGQPPSDGTAGERDTSTGNTSSDGDQA